MLAIHLHEIIEWAIKRRAKGDLVVPTADSELSQSVATALDQLCTSLRGRGIDASQAEAIGASIVVLMSEKPEDGRTFLDALAKN